MPAIAYVAIDFQEAVRSAHDPTVGRLMRTNAAQQRLSSRTLLGTTSRLSLAVILVRILRDIYRQDDE